MPALRCIRAGTQQIEQNVKKLFPKARVLRMDGDTTKTKNSYEEILSAFAAGKADILIGTQMIVKGHDFANVTLVGIILADLTLFQNDYRAGERTFDLITQAAGRAGRGEQPGKVVIQTYKPEHYAIKAAAGQDYIRSCSVDDRNMKIIGPSAPVIAKIRDIYRRVVYIKNYRYNELVVLKDQIEQYISEKKEVQDLSLQFDFNPLNMY